MTITVKKGRTYIKDRGKFFRFILLSSLILNFIILGVLFPSRTSADFEADPIQITVRRGDSLWSIAEEYCPEGKDLRNFVYEIKKENSLSGSSLSIGQKILVPVN